MDPKPQTSILSANTLELHYWFSDNSHSMDAFIQNRCEFELLNILKDISTRFNIQISIDTEPISEGGIRRWFKIISKQEGKKAAITTTVVAALLTVLLTTPLTKFSEKMIERLFEDTELKKLEKEKMKLEIEKLKQETLKNSQLLNENLLLNKRRSNFYQTLDSSSRVVKITFNLEDENKQSVLESKSIAKSEFREFIIHSDDLPSLHIENATIEIISPVLKNGKFKWLGIYEGAAIHFNMKSEEFKNLVQGREVEFKNGFSINCFLEIRRKINSEGMETITGYDVNRVNHYFENEKPIETPEGRKYRQKRDLENQQLRIFE